VEDKDAKIFEDPRIDISGGMKDELEEI